MKENDGTNRRSARWRSVEDRRMTLKQRLFILVTIALLPAVVIQAYNEFDLRRSREQEVRDLAVRQAELAASELDQIFGGVRTLLTAVAEVPSVRALDMPACVAYLATLQPRVPYLASIAVLDLQGQVVCRQEAARRDLRFSDRSYFQEAIATRAFVIGEYTDGRVALRPVLPLALPLQDTAGTVIGVVAAAMDLRWLTGKLKERGLAKGGSVTVADRNGVILARDPMADQFVGTRIPDQFQPLVHATLPGAIELTSQDGTRRVLGYVPPSTGRNYYVSAGLSSEESFAAVNRATWRGVSLIAVGLVLALLAAWIIGRTVLPAPRRSAIGRGGSLARRRLRHPYRSCQRTGRVRCARRRVRRHGGRGGAPAIRA